MLQVLHFGRGFDSPHLHQPPLRAVRREAEDVRRSLGEGGRQIGTL